MQAPGKPPEACFAEIDETPIAAASSVKSTSRSSRNGSKVAVKILYPGIRGVIAVDLRVLRLAIVAYKRFVPIAKIERVHESLVDLLRRETDYLHEAACMERMGKNFAASSASLSPKSSTALTTKDVLTMTFMEGIKITKLGELRAAGVKTDEDIALRLPIQSFYKMLFVDRFFHADPHPGNFLVKPPQDGRPRPSWSCSTSARFRGGSRVRVLVDGMVELLAGFFGQDDAAVVRGFRHMGFVAPGGNDKLLEKTVKTYFAKLLKIQDRSAAALMRAKPEQLPRARAPRSRARRASSIDALVRVSGGLVLRGARLRPHVLARRADRSRARHASGRLPLRDAAPGDPHGERERRDGSAERRDQRGVARRRVRRGSR